MCLNSALNTNWPAVHSSCFFIRLEVWPQVQASWHCPFRCPNSFHVPFPRPWSLSLAAIFLCDLLLRVRSAAQCMMTSGWMLKSRSSLPRRTSSSRAVSSVSASLRSEVVRRGMPFNFTMMSPSLMPPLKSGAKL